MSTYRLTRRLPDGTVRRHPGAFRTRRDVSQAVAYVLADNGAASRKDAAAFAFRFESAPTGTEAGHASGYAFTVTEEKPAPSRVPQAA